MRPLAGRNVSAIGIGSARWALAAEPDVELAVRTLNAAADHGITLLDTAPAYTPPGHPGFAEDLIGARLGPAIRRGELTLVTKGGHWRVADQFPIDGRAEVLHRQCRESLVRLRLDVLDLYLLHWPDPEVPIEDSVGALAELRDQGLVRGVGVCNVDLDLLARARSTTRIDAVQNRFSAVDQDGRAVVDVCAELGIAYLAYSPLGGPAAAADPDRLLPGVVDIATRMGVTVQELCLAWLLAQSPGLIPICGAGRPSSVSSAVHAATLWLTASDLDELNEGVLAR